MIKIMKQTTVGVFGLLLSSQLFSQTMGSRNIEDQRIVDVSHLGNLKGKSVVVEKHSSVTGNVRMEKSVFLSGLSVTGNVSLNDSEVKGELEVTGNLTLTGSKAKEVTVVGRPDIANSSIESMTFTNSKGTFRKVNIDKIIVKVENSKESPKVYITDLSKVGSVIFRGLKGTVVVDGSVSSFTVENGSTELSNN